MMDDLINRKAVLNEIRKIECEPGYHHQGEDWSVGLCIAESIVKEAESVESKQKKGEWMLYESRSNIYDLEGVCTWGKSLSV